MKNFLAGWIVLQLVCLGWAAGSVQKQVAEKTYVCSTATEPGFVITSMIFPLAFFMNEDQSVVDYCSK
jgi:hypothetical protein